MLVEMRTGQKRPQDCGLRRRLSRGSGTVLQRRTVFAKQQAGVLHRFGEGRVILKQIQTEIFSPFERERKNSSLCSGLDIDGHISVCVSDWVKILCGQKCLLKGGLCLGMEDFEFPKKREAHFVR